MTASFSQEYLMTKKLSNQTTKRGESSERKQMVDSDKRSILSNFAFVRLNVFIFINDYCNYRVKQKVNPKTFIYQITYFLVYKVKKSTIEMGNIIWRVLRKPQDDALTKLAQHETNCIRPPITVCLLWRALEKMLQNWDLTDGGIDLNREIIVIMREEGIAAAAQVKREAELVKATQIQNKVSYVSISIIQNHFNKLMLIVVGYINVVTYDSKGP